MGAHHLSAGGNPVNFENPPVGEVVLAVQFAGPVADEATILGRYWPTIESRFPIVESQPALAPMFEDFVNDAQPQMTFQVGPPAPRYWFRTQDRTRLVQLQPDRMAFNWIRESAKAPYPRYQRIRADFLELYEHFEALCEAQGHPLVPTWCEITYINPIEQSGNGDLAELLVRVNPSDLLGMGPAEDTNLHERYTLVRDGEPYGRFMISATPGVRVEDGAKLSVLTLAARGRVLTGDREGMLAFFDEGRDLIVRGFEQMTTQSMRDRWGHHDAG